MRCYHFENEKFFDAFVFVPLGIRRKDFPNQTLPILNDPDRQNRLNEYRQLASEEIDLQERMNEHRIIRNERINPNE